MKTIQGDVSQLGQLLILAKQARVSQLKGRDSSDAPHQLYKTHITITQKEYTTRIRPMTELGYEAPQLLAPVAGHGAYMRCLRTKKHLLFYSGFSNNQIHDG